MSKRKFTLIAGLSLTVLLGAAYFFVSATMHEIVELEDETKDEVSSTHVIKPDSAYPEQQSIKITRVKNVPNVLNNEPIILKYKFKRDETIHYLYLQKVVTNTGITLMPEYATATPALIPSPNGDKYLFEDDDSIFSIETESLNVKQLTQDVIHGYDKFKLKEELKENQSLFWATNPAWSLDGTKVSYVSNRSTAGHSGMEIWVIDLLKDTESQLYSNSQPLGTFGWTSSNDLLIWEDSKDRSIYSIKELSLNGETAPALLQNVDFIDLSRDGKKILYSPSRPSRELWIFDIKTREEQRVLSVDHGIQFDPTARFSPEGDKIVALKYTGTKGERTVYVANVSSGSTQIFESADNEIFTATPEWVNNDTLLLNVEHSGKSESKLLSVDLRDY